VRIYEFFTLNSNTTNTFYCDFLQYIALNMKVLALCNLVFLHRRPSYKGNNQQETVHATVRQFRSSTIRNGVLMNVEQKMMGLLKFGKSHDVEFYHENVTFQSVMARRALYIYIYALACGTNENRSTWEEFELIRSGIHFSTV
jgi:hypothetical protein